MTFKVRDEIVQHFLRFPDESSDDDISQAIFRHADVRQEGSQIVIWEGSQKYTLKEYIAIVRYEIAAGIIKPA